MDQGQFLNQLGLTPDEFVDLERRFSDLKHLVNNAQAEAIGKVMKSPEEIFGDGVSESQLNEIISQLSSETFLRPENDATQTSKFVSFPPGTGPGPTPSGSVHPKPKPPGKRRRQTS